MAGELLLTHDGSLTSIMNSNSTATLGKSDLIEPIGQSAPVTPVWPVLTPLKAQKSVWIFVTFAPPSPSVAVEFEFIIDVKDQLCVSSSSPAICACLLFNGSSLSRWPSFTRRLAEWLKPDRFDAGYIDLPTSGEILKIHWWRKSRFNSKVCRLP